MFFSVQFQQRVSGCMVQCSEGPGSPTYMTPMPSVLIFIAIRLWWWQHPKSFIVYDDDNMLKNVLQLPQSWQFSQTPHLMSSLFIKGSINILRTFIFGMRDLCEKNFEQVWVYAKFLHSPLSLLKLLQKVSINRRQKFVDTHFSHKVGFPAKMGRKYLKHLFGKYLPYSSKMWAESDSLMAFCWLWYQVSEGKTGHHINVLIANGKTFIRFSFIAPIF